MTTNIILGNAAQFVAEFIDANGNTTIPSGGTLNITYPVGLTTTSTSIQMSPVNQFLTATWASSVSALGLASWNITAIGSTITQAQGTLRIITP